MKTVLPLILSALSLCVLGTQTAQAQDIQGDVEAARDKVAMCIGCHGITDYKTAFPEVYKVPKIAGQNAEYLTVAIEQYRSGERRHPSMQGIAGTLTDQDVADVAAYYQELGASARERELPTASKPSASVESLLQKGGCVSCHGDNFSNPIDPAYPKLSGQHPDYLFVALRSYRDDTHLTWGRKNAIMAAQVKQFSDAELKSISKYIGSLPGQIETVTGSYFAATNPGR